ncbi:MAG: histidine phosphatase family protein [Micrococcaceae bacterium]|nr:histidine phosphatase family protein [Micrococcaceae bacterium]
MVLKHLILLRHAESDWTTGVPDRLRPINDKGIKDAVQAGLWLTERELIPDYALCSSAQRAKKTLSGVFEGIGQQKIKVSYDDHLYNFDANSLLETIRKVPAETGTLLVVGHNPAIASLARDLASQDSEQRALDEMQREYPSLGMSVFTVDVTWNALGNHLARLRLFVVPRS